MTRQLPLRGKQRISSRLHDEFQAAPFPPPPPPPGWNFVAITWLVSARAEIWNCREKWETAILFRWKHNHWACPSSVFSPGLNFNAITWGFSEFQPGLRFPARFVKPARAENRHVIGPKAAIYRKIHLGAAYMANFSPVSRAEISPRPPEQIFLKRRLRLHGENLSPGWDFQPGLGNRDGIFSPGWNSEKPHVIALKFQPGLKSELERAQWLRFQRNKMAVSHFSPQF